MIMLINGFLLTSVFILNRDSLCISQVSCNNLGFSETQTGSNIGENETTVQRVVDMNKSFTVKSIKSNEVIYVNTCEKCPESNESVSSDEATYMNTYDGYLDANDLRQAGPIESSCETTLSSNQSYESNKSTCNNTCEGYLDDKDPCPTTCGGATMAVPILRLPWLTSQQSSRQIGEADEHVLTLATNVEYFGLHVHQLA